MGPNQKYRKEYMRIPDLPARVKTLKRQELNVLANIMTPYSCRPVRICASTGVNNPPLTAVSTNFLVEDYDLQSLLSLTEGQIVELPEIDKNQLLWNLPNDISVVLLQDTYTPLIYPKYTGDTVGVYYDTIFLDPNFTHGNTPYYDIEVEPNEVFADVMNQKISPLSLIRNSSDTGWPETIPCYTISGKRCFWVDASHHVPSEVRLKLSMRFNTFINNYDLKMNLWKYYPGEGFAMEQTAFFPAAGTGSDTEGYVNLDYSGYYTIALEGSLRVPSGEPSARFSASVKLTMSTSVATHHVINKNVADFGYQQTGYIPQFDSIQTIGTSLLWQNVSPDFIKGGTTSGYTWSGDSPWYDITSAPETDFLNKNNRLIFNGLWSEGMYGYVRPITTGFTKHTAVLNVREAPDSANTIISYNRGAPVDPTGVNPAMPNCRGMSVFRIKPPAPTNPATSFGSVTSRLIVTSTFEFTTTSQNYALGRPTVFPPMYSELVTRHLNALIPFSNNADHITTMWNRIKGIANTIDDGYTVVKKILGTASGFVDGLLGLTNVVGF